MLLEHLGERLVIDRQVILFAKHPSVFSNDAMKLSALANGVLEFGVEN